MIIVNYLVDKELHYNSDTPHNIELITTEYLYKNDILAYLQTGKNISLKINDFIQEHFNKRPDFPSEQYFIKKSYGKGKIKSMTRSTFEEKLKKFDMSKTVVEREFLEKYVYTDKTGKTDSVQIIITAKASGMTAVIDFKDAEQNINFVRPEWLVEAVYQ